MKGLPIAAKEMGWGFWSAVLWLPSMYEDLDSTAVTERGKDAKEEERGWEDGNA